MANKFRNVRTIIDGISFMSRKEANRYSDLMLMQESGEIEELCLQPKFPIYVNRNKICTVILDFQYIDCKSGMMVFEDVKGVDTAISKLKRKLVEAVYNIKVLLT